jgi:hypothetical protein
VVVQNGELWAVSAYFNPAGFARRLENFRTFRRRLAVPLIAVEVAFERDFELRPGDAEVLVQLRNPDVMWHKEAMLEIGFRHCPAACEAIAWLDADVFFERPDWPAAALDALAHAPVVQLSERVDHCAPGADSGGVLFSQRSAAAAIAAGGCAVDALSSLLDRDAAAVATGFAWAARREFLARHGLYTRSIAGGGDTALVCALYGCPEVCVAHHNLNAAQERSLRDWAAPLSRDVEGRVGFVPGLVHHLWHGRMEDRHARERHRVLADSGFDPERDLARDAGGLWRWATPPAELRSYLREYFHRRREDDIPETSGRAPRRADGDRLGGA